MSYKNLVNFENMGFVEQVTQQKPQIVNIYLQFFFHVVKFIALGKHFN